MVTIVHLLLAGILFFVINWVGKHSHSLGYISLSLFVKRDEAPAFNLALRLLGPLVFVTVIAAFFYAFGLDIYVQDIWKVALYYFIGRTAFNLIMGRALLINWVREVAIGSICIWITWLIYDGIIKYKKSLLPDFTTVTNELWVFVAVFVYAVLNKIDTGTKSAERRKQRYLRMRFGELSSQFGHLLRDRLPDDLSRSIAMTILLYESFNRPQFAQKLEHWLFPIWGKSLGPMQVTTTQRISDEESVNMGFMRIAGSYVEWNREAEGKVGEAYDQHWRRWYLVRKVAADYNRDNTYVSDVAELHATVLQLFYPELKKLPDEA